MISGEQQHQQELAQHSKDRENCDNEDGKDNITTTNNLCDEFVIPLDKWLRKYQSYYDKITLYEDHDDVRAESTTTTNNNNHTVNNKEANKYSQRKINGINL